MKIAVFNTEVDRLEYLANLLGQVDLTFEQVVYCQAELSKVKFY